MLCSVRRARIAHACVAQLIVLPVIRTTDASYSHPNPKYVTKSHIQHDVTKSHIQHGDYTTLRTTLTDVSPAFEHHNVYILTII